jgi:hypothetical protein
MAASYILGNQDFADGTIITLAGFLAASTEEPEPFRTVHGADPAPGNVFNESWTFNYPPAAVASASITIGIGDHDSQAPGSQLAAFTLDGIDLTSLLNSAFESHGGSQAELNVYTLAIPATAWPALSDGTAQFALRLQPPSLPGSLPGNAAALDFSRLDVVPVPEPTTALLLGIAVPLLAIRRRDSGQR